MPLFGIDVSKWNGDLNFTAIKNAGVSFAMVKASQGHALNSKHYLFADSHFVKNVTGFARAGIPVGAYHFFTASNEEETYKEAEFFIRVCEPVREHLTLYLACDAENYGNRWLADLSKETLSRLISLFCKKVEDAGFEACHYTNTDHIRNFIDLESIPYPVWQAHYLSEGKVSRPADAKEKLAIHQYSASGQLPGMAGQFDLNFGYAPLARRIVQTRTPLEDQTMEYILRHENGESILVRLAQKLAERALHPVKDTSPAHLIEVIRFHCALSEEETAYLVKYRWWAELFTKLYRGLIDNEGR